MNSANIGSFAKPVDGLEMGACYEHASADLLNIPTGLYDASPY